MKLYNKIKFIKNINNETIKLNKLSNDQVINKL